VIAGTCSRTSLFDADDPHSDDIVIQAPRDPKTEDSDRRPRKSYPRRGRGGLGCDREFLDGEEGDRETKPTNHCLCLGPMGPRGRLPRGRRPDQVMYPGELLLRGTRGGRGLWGHCRGVDTLTRWCTPASLQPSGRGGVGGPSGGGR
jgi:hypothetical protein